MRIFLTKDVPDIPGSLKSQILRLRRLDQSLSIVPSSPSARRGIKYRGGYRDKQYTIVQGTEASSWRWTVRLDEKTIKSGHAISQDAAMNRVVWLIEKPVSRAQFRRLTKKKRPPAGEAEAAGLLRVCRIQGRNWHGEMPDVERGGPAPAAHSRLCWGLLPFGA
jgi:hypothetical protein